MVQLDRLLAVCGLMLVFTAACHSDAPTETTAKEKVSLRFEDAPQSVTQYVAKPADFDCILHESENPQTSWHRVRNFYLKNMTGRTQEALDVANGVKPGPYPIGTIIQLIYFEAMVKRGGGYSPTSNDWEFFSLDVQDGATVIERRGRDEVVNFGGGNCFECHQKARPEFDFVCEQTNGCEPLGVTPAFISQMQSGDPRCK